MEVMLTTDIQIFQAALYHPLGRIAIEHHHTLRERAVIDTNTYRTLQRLGALNKSTESLAYLLMHGTIDLIIPLGRTLTIDVVTRIDAHLLYILQCRISCCWVEVNISDQGSRDTTSTELFMDHTEVSSHTLVLCSIAQILRTSGDDALCLSDSSLRIQSRSCRH